jgi:hypothetical protein
LGKSPLSEVCTSGTIPVVMSFGIGDLVAAGFATSIRGPAETLPA